MQYLDFKRTNSYAGPQLLGQIFVLAGVFALSSPLFLAGETPLERTWIVGIPAILLGLLIVNTYSGTLMHVSERKVKEYVSVSGYRWGNWTALPAIAMAKVVPMTYMSINTPNGISPTLSGKITEYKLLSEDVMTEFSFTYTNREKAIHKATQLATMLNIPLDLERLDCA